MERKNSSIIKVNGNFSSIKRKLIKGINLLMSESFIVITEEIINEIKKMDPADWKIVIEELLQQQSFIKANAELYSDLLCVLCCRMKNENTSFKNILKDCIIKQEKSLHIDLDDPLTLSKSNFSLDDDETRIIKRKKYLIYFYELIARLYVRNILAWEEYGSRLKFITQHTENPTRLAALENSLSIAIPKMYYTWEGLEYINQNLGKKFITNALRNYENSKRDCSSYQLHNFKWDYCEYMGSSYDLPDYLNCQYNYDQIISMKNYNDIEQSNSSTKVYFGTPLCGYKYFDPDEAPMTFKSDESLSM